MGSIFDTPPPPGLPPLPPPPPPPSGAAPKHRLPAGGRKSTILTEGMQNRTDTEKAATRTVSERQQLEVRIGNLELQMKEARNGIDDTAVQIEEAQMKLKDANSFVPPPLARTPESLAKKAARGLGRILGPAGSVYNTKKQMGDRKHAIAQSKKDLEGAKQGHKYFQGWLRDTEAELRDKRARLKSLGGR